MPSTPRTLLGMLTPSSNTILEPVTSAILGDTPDISAHFSRFTVTEIALSERALGQFDREPMLAAADLLADARVQTICWNGTSAGWLGFERDTALCAAITERTGIPACSCVLAINEIFRALGVRTFGLVTPYIDEVQDRIIGNFAGHGFECAADRRLQVTENFAFSEFTVDEIAGHCRDVAAAGPDAIIVLCTNMNGAPAAAAIEAETGIPVIDSVSASVWAAMRQAGADPARITGWGRFFQEVK